MYMIMVGGHVVNMTNNKSRAAQNLALILLANAPKADIARAAGLFANGTSVTIGRVAAIAA